MGSLDAAIMTGFICRLCSKMNRCVIHMYGEEGRRLKLVSRIKEYLPVVIEPDDPLPKTICRQCIHRLQCHHRLMRQITLARKRLSKKMEAVQERVHVFQREGTPPPNNYTNGPESRITSHSDHSSSSHMDSESEQTTLSVLSVRNRNED